MKEGNVLPLQVRVYCKYQTEKSIRIRRTHTTKTHSRTIHAQRINIAFSLVVDDFGVRYTKREDIDHLLETLENRYPRKEDWNPTFYLSVTL